MNIHKPSSLTLCLAIAATLGAAQAQAQVQLEEIVVTAQRTETSLQRTPISVTAFDATALEQRGVTDLMDLAISTPNLSIGSRAGAGAARGAFSIRAMGVNADNGSAAVGVYVDEVYFPSSWGNNLGLLDTERVEVLRGPQGTLFGRNTIAGAIQYVSIKPSQQFEGHVEATGGNLDREALNGVINVPLGDTVAMRLSASYDQQGGYVTDDLNKVDRGEVENTLGRLQLRWTPTANLTIDLKAEDTRQKNNGRPVGIVGLNPFAQLALASGATQFLPPPAPPGSFTTTLTPALLSTREYHFAGYNAPDGVKSDGNIYAGVLTWKLTDAMTLKSISAYSKNESRVLIDIDQSPLPIAGGDRGLWTDKVFTEELQLAGRSLSDRLGWTLGVYYYDSEASVIGQKTSVGPAFVIPVSDRVDEVQSTAFYGQATYDLTDKLAVTAGVRYSEEEVESTNLGGGFPSLVPTPYSNDIKYTDTSPHYGLNFQVTDDAMLYAKASKGFRAGGFTVEESFVALNGAIPYDPETAWTYEIGARLEFMDRRLRVNPTVFFTDWQDIQFNQLLILPTVGPRISTQNAGDAEIKGMELEVQLAATDRLTLTASGSYLDSAYTRVDNLLLQVFPYGPTDFAANIGVNDPLQQSPEYKFSIGGRYTQPIGSAELVTSLDFGWTDEQQSAVTRSDRILMPSYGLLNGRVLYQPGDMRWSVALYGNNLLDKYYLIGGTGFGKGFTVGVDEIEIGRPREYGVTLRFNF